MARVMLIEDDADIRTMITLLLELEGFEVLAAANGEDGLEALRGGERPCVILLDLMMPGMNGWQFREAQTQEPELAELPVVVLSGDGRGLERADELGAAAFLKKPIDLEELLATVRHFAGG